jgi:nucleosome binding factor SPN SPT16 subunit
VAPKRVNVVDEVAGSQSGTLTNAPIWEDDVSDESAFSEDEEGSEVDDDISGDESEDYTGDESEEGEDWDELEKKAARADRGANFRD